MEWHWNVARTWSYWRRSCGPGSAPHWARGASRSVAEWAGPNTHTNLPNINLEAPSHPQVSHVAICIPEPNREGDSEAGNFSLAKWTHHTFCIDFTDLQVPWWKGRLYEVLQFDTTSKRMLPYKILCNCVPFWWSNLNISLFGLQSPTSPPNTAV